MPNNVEFALKSLKKSDERKAAKLLGSLLLQQALIDRTACQLIFSQDESIAGKLPFSRAQDLVRDVREGAVELGLIAGEDV